MSRSIDERIVSMKFDNDQFERGAQKTLATLDELKNSIDLDSSSKGLNNFSVAPILEGVEGLKQGFSALDVVAITAISKITSALMDKLGGAIENTIGLISSKGMTRALNLEQARFSLRGLLYDVTETGDTILKYGYDVEDVMVPVNNAVKGTAYGLDEAAKASTNFIASGITDLDELERTLKSIAGTAAQTGSSYDEIAHIFQRVAGANRVYATDLNSIAARGLNAAAAIRDYLQGKSLNEIFEIGGMTDEANELVNKIAEIGGVANITEGDIRNFTSKGYINLKMFAEAMYEAFGDNAYKANETYSGSLSNVGAALGRLGAKFQSVKLEYMKDIFNALIPLIDEFSKTIDPIITLVNDLARSIANFAIDKIEGLTAFVKDLRSIKDFGAWERFDEISKNLSKVEQIELKKQIEAEAITPIERLALTARNFGKGFQNIGSAFKIAFTSINPFGKALEKIKGYFEFLPKNLFNTSEKFVVFTEKIKEFTENIFKSDGFGYLSNIFSTLSNVVKFFINILKELGNVIKKVFGSFDNTGITTFFESIIKKGTEFAKSFSSNLASLDLSFISEGVGKALTFLEPLIIKAGDALQQLKNIITPIAIDIKDFLAPWVIKLGEGLSSLGPSISPITSKLNEFLQPVSKLPSLIGGTTGGLTEMKVNLPPLKRDISSLAMSMNGFEDSVGGEGGFKPFELLGTALEKLRGLVQKAVGAIPGGLSKIVEGIKGFFSGIEINASTISAGVVIKFLYDFHQKLKNLEIVNPLTNIADTIETALQSIVDSFTSIQEAMQKQINVELIKSFAIALAILTGSFLLLSTIPRDKLIEGGLALLSVSGMIVGAMKLLSKVDAIKVPTKTIVGFATSILIISAAFKMLSSEDIDLGQSVLALLAITTALTAYSAVVIAMSKSEKPIQKSTIALVSLASSMLLMARVVKTFGEMDPNILAQGLKEAGKVLLAITAFSVVTSKFGSMSFSAGAGVLALAVALMAFAGVLQIFGTMNPDVLANGLMYVALSLIVLGTALVALSTWGGNVAASAAAILIMSAAMIVLATALTALSIIPFELLALGLGTVVATLVIFGTAAAILQLVAPAMMVMSAAMLIFGAGILALAVAMTLMTPVMAAFTVSLIGSLQILLSGIVSLAPLAKEAFIAVLKAMIDGLLELGVVIVDSFLKFLLELGASIKNNIGPLVVAGIEVAAAFLKGLTEKIGDLVLAGVEFIVSFIKGLAEAIDKKAEDINEAIVKLVKAIVNGFVKFITTNGPKAWEAVKKFAEKIIKKLKEVITLENIKNIVVKAFTGIIKGIGSLLGKIINAVKELGKSIIEKFKNFLGINSPSTKFAEMGKDIILGLIKGIGGLALNVVTKIGEVATNVFNKAKDLLSIDKLKTVGKNLMDGIKNGIGDKWNSLKEKAAEISTNLKDKFGQDLESGKLLNVGKNVLEGIKNGIQEKWPNLFEKVSTVVSDVKNYLTDNLAPEKTKTAGQTAVTGIDQGLKENLPGLKETAKTVGMTTKDVIEGRVSKDNMYNVGSRAVSGFGSGLNANAGTVYAYAENIGKTTASKMDKEDDFYDTGYYAMKGFEKGFKDRAENHSYSVATGVANSIVKKMNYTLEVKSPSRVFYRIGEYCMMGFENAFKDDSSINNAVSNLGGSISTKLQNSLDDLETAQPVISPILDLDDIQNGTKQINGLLSNNPALMTTASINSRQSNNPISDAINQLTARLNGFMEKELTPEDIYEAIRTGAENASFVVKIDGKTITSVVNKNNSNTMATRMSYL